MQASAQLAGREALVAQVVEAVRATRVTVLTGPPGVGKTRIANAAFERLETDGRKPARIYGTAAGRDVPLSAFSSLLDGSWASATDGFGLARAREAVGAAPHHLGVFEPEQEFMRAEASAYAGDLAGARTYARHAAEAAHTLGQRPIAVLAWNAVARYGDPHTAVTGVGDVSFDRPVSALMRGQIAALDTSDPQALHEIAEGYAAIGLRPLAADAFATLTHIAANSGDARLEARAAQRLATILDEGEPLSLVATRMPRSAHALTTRERDVAALAAAGLPDSAIAERLGLSVRTVQTHLAHVYAKTNTAGRRELAALMNAPTPPR